jgi:hypothetical protein
VRGERHAPANSPLSPERDPVPVVREIGCAPEAGWTSAEIILCTSVHDYIICIMLYIMYIYHSIYTPIYIHIHIHIHILSLWSRNGCVGLHSMLLRYLTEQDSDLYQDNP